MIVLEYCSQMLKTVSYLSIYVLTDLERSILSALILRILKDRAVTESHIYDLTDTFAGIIITFQ